jgi:hypothetical protein
MFEVFRGRPEGQLAVFRDLEQARVWLGVEKLPAWVDR